MDKFREILGPLYSEENEATRCKILSSVTDTVENATYKAKLKSVLNTGTVPQTRLQFKRLLKEANNFYSDAIWDAIVLETMLNHWTELKLSGIFKIRHKAVFSPMLARHEGWIFIEQYRTKHHIYQS